MACKKENIKIKTIELCRRNLEFFFDSFLYTYDPRRKKDRACTFILWPYQRDFLKKLEQNFQDKKPLLVEKSRDMGFSWLFLGWILHKMLFSHGFSAGIGSRKASLVDEKGSMRSLIERVRYMLRLLPKWLQGGYIESIHSKIGQLVIPATESILSGEGGDNIGRGDRTSIYFLDEWAHIPRSSIVHEAVSQTSDCIIYGSTPNGKGNEFSRLKYDGKIDVFSMHWKLHPDKDDAWYNKQKETLTPEQIAQELDISYAKSTKGRVYKWFDAQKHANENIEYNPNYPLLVTFDWGINDPTVALFIQYYKNTIHIIDYFEESDSNITYIFSDLVIGKLRQWKLSFSDVSGWYGDPDARNRNLLTGESISNFVFKTYRVKLRFKLPNLIAPRVLAVRGMGTRGFIKVSRKLTHIADCLENYKYPDKDHGENEKPLHDWTSHICSALEYYCVFEHPVATRKQSGIIGSQRFR